MITGLSRLCSLVSVGENLKRKRNGVVTERVQAKLFNKDTSKRTEPNVRIRLGQYEDFNFVT